MVSPNSIARELLRARYARIRRPIAFLDESVRPGSDQTPGMYSIVAVIVEPETLDELRSEILHVVGDTWWHTTEVYDRGEHDRIHQFATWAASSPLDQVLCIQVPMTSHSSEQSRRECFAHLMGVLQKRNVGLVVLEKRQTKQEQNADAGLFTRLKSTGLISRQLDLMQASPSVEPLLWTPDLVAWVTGRHLVLGDDKWLRGLESTVVLVKTHSDGETSGLNKKPEPAAASGSGSESLVGLEDEGAARSYDTIMPRIVELVRVRFNRYQNVEKSQFGYEEIRDWINANFPV